ncbi:unnamed protein product, partial [Linum tenue]
INFNLKTEVGVAISQEVSTTAGRAQIVVRDRIWWPGHQKQDKSAEEKLTAEKSINSLAVIPWVAPQTLMNSDGQATAWSEAMEAEDTVPPGFEPRSLDSKSRVLTTTPWNRLLMPSLVLPFAKNNQIKSRTEDEIPKEEGENPSPKILGMCLSLLDQLHRENSQQV